MSYDLGVGAAVVVIVAVVAALRLFVYR